MKKILVLILLSIVPPLAAQNWTTVTASNISYQKNGNKLSGKACFTGTDSSDKVISFKIGGGGQAAIVSACFPVTAGVIAANSTIPNPANTAPANVRYRVEVWDSSGIVIRYRNVSFSGSTFDFDSYIPTTTNLVSGQSIDTLTVQHLRVTVDCVGSGCGTGGGGGSSYTFNAPLSESLGTVSVDLSAYASLTALNSGLAGKANTSHTHLVNQITNFPQLAQSKDCTTTDKFNGYNATTGLFTCAPDQNTGSGGGTTYSFNSPLSETGGAVSIDLSAYASLTALSSGLAGKANTSHTHTVSQITDFPTLGTAAAQNTSAFDAAGSASTVQTNLNTHTSNTANPHSVTKAQVGLGSVDNTADTAKPVSTAQQAALDLKANSSALGTAAALNVPASGNAASGEVVKGNDGRLSDARTPTSHASTHASAGSDPVTIAESQVTSLTAHLAAKADASSLATVATSGSYSDLSNKPHVITIPISGSPISTGTTNVGAPAIAGFACTINSVKILSPVSGSITVDVWKSAGAIPTSSSKISASAPVTLSSATINSSGSLTGWTTPVSSGDVFWASVATADGVLTSATIQLGCQ